MFLLNCNYGQLKGFDLIVILGANANKIEPEIARLPVKIVKNTEWNEGISSSIRCGIA